LASLTARDLREIRQVKRLADGDPHGPDAPIGTLDRHRHDDDAIGERK
jgi:hypothetical protein